MPWRPVFPLATTPGRGYLRGLPITNMHQRLALFVLLCLAATPVLPAAENVVITEFVAGNSSGLADEDGSFEDWIEVFNPSTNTVNLLNWSLTDSAGNLNKWRFPATNIGPNRFVVVFASNKDRRVPGARLHTNFRLDTGGEYLALVRPDGSIASQFTPEYPGQFNNVSFGFPMESQFIPLLATNATMRLLVPTNAGVGTNWTALAFDDSAWQAGTNAVGFDTGAIDHTSDLFANAVLEGSPLAFWRMNETAGTTATNTGRSGAAGDAAYSGTPTLAQAGPRPAAFNGFETNNNAVRFSGAGQFLTASSNLLNHRAAFSMAGWFNATALAATNIALWGQPGVAAVGISNSAQIVFWTATAGSIAASNAITLNAWHHLAAVADGQRLNIYLNGALLNQVGGASTNHGGSAAGFKAAGGGIFDGPAGPLNGLIDELAVYDRALTPGEVARLYQSAAAPDVLPLPTINLARTNGSTATQSSTYPNGEAARAIDGNTSGVFANGSVTHTAVPSINNEWWEVDLRGTQRIDRVHLWFRTDCCTTRAENLRIIIYDSTNVATRTALWTQNVGTLPGSNRYFDVQPPVNGRVVRVEHPSGITEIISLAEVQVFQFDYGAVPGITTDVRAAMFNSNATALLRYPFVLTNAVEDIDQVVLRVRYDDGFVAWLNGTRIASRNAPEEPQWNSTATAAQTQRILVNEDAIDVSAFRLALLPGTNVLAVQGLNIAPENPDFFLSARLEATILGRLGTDARYFMTPTPGDINGTGTADLGPIITGVAHLPKVPLDSEDLAVTARVVPTFAPLGSVLLHYRVMFDAVQTATMFDDGLHGDGAAGDGVFGGTIPQNLGTNGQMIRYYLTAQDTSNRVSRWPLFTDPLGSAEYLGTVVAETNVTSRLPVFQVFVAADQLAGIDAETGGRIAVFYDGEFYDNVYMERRGNTSASFAKKSHRVEFNREHPFRHPGPGGRVRKTSFLAEYPDPAYIRQGLCFWLLDLMGVPAPFHYPVRLQMNGAFYQLAFHNDVIGEEQIERLGYDPAGALYKAAGCVKTDHFSTGVYQKMLPKNVASTADFDQMAGGVAETNTLAGRRVALFDLFDVPQVINHLAGARWCSENDDVWANMSLYRDTFGDGLWRAVPFDMNASWGQLYGGSNPLQATNDLYKSHPLYGGSAIPPLGGGPASPNNWNRLYDAFIAVPETREMLLRRERSVLDRWVKPPPGHPNTNLLESHIQSLTNAMRVEADLDRVKWGFSSWAANKWFTNGIDDLFTQFIGPRRRHWDATHSATNPAWVIGITATNNAGIPPAQPATSVVQFASLEFNPSSSNQAQEFLSITNPNNHSLDISNWELDGGVEFAFKEGTVIPARGLLYVSPDVKSFRARASGPRGGQGLFVVGPYRGQLTARGETVRLLNSSNQTIASVAYSGSPTAAQLWLRITEIMYHPGPTNAGDLFPQEDHEYLELKNISTNVTLNLAGVHFTNGIEFAFTSSNVFASLAPGRAIVLVKNPAAFIARHGTSTNIAGTFAGSLDNSGERISLHDAAGEEILDFSYNNAWHPITDGLGFSLVIVDENAPFNTWDEKESWRASGTLNGSPGAADPAPPVLAPVLVNEVLASSIWPETDAIEIWNPGTNAAAIGGWFLSDDFFTPKKFRIAAGTSVSAGGFLAFTEAQFNSVPGAPTNFALGDMGDEAFIFAADGAGNLLGYYHGFHFGASGAGVTFGRHVTSTGDEHVVARQSNTLGQANSGPLVGPVVVSEIMYRPPDVNGTDDSANEYIELLNITTNVVLLFDPAAPTNCWRLRDAVKFTFPTNTTLAPGQFALVVKFDPQTNAAALAAFRTKWNAPTNALLFGPWDGQLDNSGDNVELVMPQPFSTNGWDFVMVDKVDYRDDAPWNAGADGLGLALHRLVVSDYGNDPTNWTAAAPGPGSPRSDGPVPLITLHPAGFSTIAGATTNLIVAASGSNLVFQWRFNGAPLPAATNATLMLSNISLAQAGAYSVLVWNGAGAAQSSNAAVTVLQPAFITTQPLSQTGPPGTNVTFNVAAAGSGTLRYQWSFGGVPIPDATNSSLGIVNAQLPKHGYYSVRVTDDISTVESAPALLYVLVRPGVLVQPLNMTVVQGANVTLSGTVTGAWPISLRWLVGGVNTTNLTATNFPINATFVRGGTNWLNITMSTAGTACVSTITMTNLQATTTFRFAATNLASGSVNTQSTTATITVLKDSDGDGVPDVWEAAHGMITNNASDGLLDFDNDGMINRDEYFAGTSPTNAASVLKVFLTQTNLATPLQFDAQSNITYTIQYRTNFDAAPWQTLSKVAPQAAVRTILFASPPETTNNPRYFRVLVPPVP
jgi:hypothetical protein